MRPYFSTSPLKSTLLVVIFSLSRFSTFYVCVFPFSSLLKLFIIISSVWLLKWFLCVFYFNLHCILIYFFYVLLHILYYCIVWVKILIIHMQIKISKINLSEWNLCLIISKLKLLKRMSGNSDIKHELQF